MQQEAAHKLCAFKPDGALGVAVHATIVSAHRERHAHFAIGNTDPAEWQKRTATEDLQR